MNCHPSSCMDLNNTVCEIQNLDFDNRLIKLVKKHPILYTNSSCTRKDRETSYAIWETIAAELRVTAADARKRWESLRSQYIAWLAKIVQLKNENKMDGKRLPKFGHSSSMTFVQPYLNSSRIIPPSQRISVINLENSDNSICDSDSNSAHDSDSFEFHHFGTSQLPPPHPRDNIVMSSSTSHSHSNSPPAGNSDMPHFQWGPKLTNNNTAVPLPLQLSSPMPISPTPSVQAPLSVSVERESNGLKRRRRREQSESQEPIETTMWTDRRRSVSAFPGGMNYGDEIDFYAASLAHKFRRIYHSDPRKFSKLQLQIQIEIMIFEDGDDE